MQLDILKFDLLSNYPELGHGVVLRQASHLEDELSGLNVGFLDQDVSQAIANRKIIQDSFKLKELVFPTQVHGNKVWHVQDRDLDFKLKIEADALFTTDKNIGLAVNHADCQAGIFYDPINKAIGIAHSGWRGNVQNIYRCLIESMKNEIGTNPNDLKVCISPSLGPCHAEFIHFERELPSSWLAFREGSSCNFNLWEVSKSQLINAGVLRENIEIASICTYCRKDLFFSFRRNRVTGRNASVVFLKDQNVTVS